ncbi:hypothetical protein [Baekduia soli]|nr:hypothetical protein [Baekduia soli]
MSRGSCPGAAGPLDFHLSCLAALTIVGLGQGRPTSVTLLWLGPVLAAAA